jgi:hypothetical protein
LPTMSEMETKGISGSYLEFDDSVFTTALTNLVRFVMRGDWSVGQKIKCGDSGARAGNNFTEGPSPRGVMRKVGNPTS